MSGTTIKLSFKLHRMFLLFMLPFQTIFQTPFFSSNLLDDDPSSSWMLHSYLINRSWMIVQKSSNILSNQQTSSSHYLESITASLQITGETSSLQTKLLATFFYLLVLPMCLITIDARSLGEKSDLITRNSDSSTTQTFQLNSTDQNVSKIQTERQRHSRSNLLQPFNVDPDKHDCSNVLHLANDPKPAKPCFLGSVPRQNFVNEGNTIILQCFIYNVNFSTVVISWWREAWLRELTLGLATVDSRHHLPRTTYQDWSLEIANAQINDSDSYMCQINLEEPVEKIYEVVVRPRPADPIATTPVPEHEFVKDQAFEQKPVRPSVSIRGHPEGHVGASLVLTCLAKFGKPIDGSSTLTTTLQWYHQSSTKRTYLITNGQHYSSSSSSSRLHDDPRPSNSLYVSPQSLHLNVELIRFDNASALESRLTFKNLTLDHAGLWYCIKFTGSSPSNDEEASVMLYVRTKTSARLQQLQAANHYSTWSSLQSTTSRDKAGKKGRASNRLQLSYSLLVLLLVAVFAIIDDNSLTALYVELTRR